VKLLYVFIAGGTGSVARYALALLGSRLGASSLASTFAANIIGCFIIGFVAELASKHIVDDTTRVMLAVGFCGGFTTFSALSIESIALFKSQQLLLGIAYIAVSFIAGLAAVLFGMYLGD
jgi:fluoride exporter